MAEAWDAAWRTALDELELSLDQAELLLHAEEPRQLPPWQPPVLSGPPPPDQLERAHRILERHLRVSHDLAETLAATGQQLRVAGALARNRPQERPVYLDVTA